MVTQKTGHSRALWSRGPRYAKVEDVMGAGSQPRSLVPQIADLARLALTDDEEKRLSLEFQRIVEYVDQVQKVQAPAEPLTATISGVRQVLRDDAVTSSPLADALLHCSPETEQRHVRVPPVL
ncbi:MAG: aspartyl-tRNA(Asn)/glutamyl-tRNA (Gln) amidotransferase subunit C [Parcubacteria group bacterium Gr01-1014_38]|nr:MAG: aspartyl-tRNA(Asn)/glutamyl-tRNA (Gln) amidotransferase subunit C [Parcubacteria group bacterium Gr01-1014_38]